METNSQEELVVPANPTIFASGAIVNTLAPNDKESTQSLFNAIKAFEAQLVLVIDNDKLYIELK
jgi:hypothetical protein